MLTPRQRKWLLSRFIGEGQLQADADSKFNKKLAALEKTGVLTCYDAMFGNNYYALTDKGLRALLHNL